MSPSSKFVRRRGRHSTPYVCHPPPPPIPPSIWTTPTMLVYTGHSVVPGFPDDDVDNWAYNCYPGVPGTYWGGGWSDGGHYSSTQVIISGSHPGDFWMEVLYDAGTYPTLYAERGGTDLEIPQPHTYNFPPWDVPPAHGTLDATLYF